MEPMEPAFFYLIFVFTFALHRFTRVKCKDKQTQVQKKDNFCISCFYAQRAFNTVVHMGITLRLHLRRTC